jgi:hypothetical protein
MLKLPDLYYSLATVCKHLEDFLEVPRGVTEDWRDEALQLNKKCRASIIECLTVFEGVGGHFPPSWLGDDPTTAKCILLKRRLDFLRLMLSITYDEDAPDPYDDRFMVDEDFKSDVHDLLILQDQLKGWLDLQSAKGLEKPTRTPLEIASRGHASDVMVALEPVSGLPTPAKSDRMFTVGDILELASISTTTLNQYAKKANVKTPGRGKRNYRYRSVEVQKILQTIIHNTTDGQMKDRCRQALLKL